MICRWCFKSSQFRIILTKKKKVLKNLVESFFIFDGIATRKHFTKFFETEIIWFCSDLVFIFYLVFYNFYNFFGFFDILSRTYKDHKSCNSVNNINIFYLVFFFIIFLYFFAFI